jgi:hypothetical protein
MDMTEEEKTSPNNKAIEGYLKLFELFDISGRMSLTVGSFTKWLLKCDLSVPRKEYYKKLGDPDGGIQKWLQTDDPYSREAVVAYAAGMYKRRLKEVIDSAQPRQRNPYRDIEWLPDKYHEIVEQITNYALNLHFEEALEFLVKLTAEWITSCSEELIRQDIIYVDQGLVESAETDADLNYQLLRRLILNFPV